MLLTRTDHACGSDRLAEACERLGLPDDAVVVNVQGDEPLIEPALITAVAQELMQRALQEGMVRFEWEHCRANGSFLSVEVTLARLRERGIR